MAQLGLHVLYDTLSRNTRCKEHEVASCWTLFHMTSDEMQACPDDRHSRLPSAVLFP